VPQRREAPVFATPLGSLFGEDALTHLSRLDAETVDLVFADPPYNAGREAWDSFSDIGAYLDWSERWMAEVGRILKPSGSLYVCGFSEVLADLKAVGMRHFVGGSCRWLVWHYRNKANLGRDWGRSHESILHLRREKFVLDVDAARVPYNAHTLKYPSHPQAESSRYGARPYVWQPNPLGAKPRDVLEVPTLTNGMREKTEHPTQKPLELVRRLVAAASAPGELVIDPFGGSGTTYVACELLARRWIGCETDATYRALIVDRLTQHLAKPLATVGTAEKPAGDAASDAIKQTTEAETRRRNQRRKLR
jgi:site-specific DNA-methyltransferase (adenine-specific)